jgi:putative transposase
MSMDWVRILPIFSGTVDQELLLRNEYLAAENRILKAQLETPLRLTDAERITLLKSRIALAAKRLRMWPML